MSTLLFPPLIAELVTGYGWCPDGPSCSFGGLVAVLCGVAAAGTHSPVSVLWVSACPRLKIGILVFILVSAMWASTVRSPCLNMGIVVFITLSSGDDCEKDRKYEGEDGNVEKDKEEEFGEEISVNGKARHDEG
ncbi:hypothetical protein BGX38DRAFT_1227774 [Terfezia claveryi]|nr:hypothetical protein BGX38DRAFT_1227774 [Terfezia claveryi]